MPVANVRGIEIYYEIEGEGEPVLFIGGTGGDLRRPPRVFKMPVARHFRVLAYDQRGLGRSSKPDAPASMADYADDAAALVEALGLDSVHVLGFSFGGMVAQELSLRHPARVRHAVWAATSAGGTCGASYPFHKLVGLGPRERARRLIELADTRSVGDPQLAEKDPAAIYMAGQAAPSPYGDEPGHAIGEMRQLEARASHDTCARLGEVTGPVLLAAGRYDGIALPENMEAMAARMPSAVLRVYEGGHIFAQQDPKAWPDIVRFLKAGALEPPVRT